jgi:putative tricarboxylic transport membrane protein
VMILSFVGVFSIRNSLTDCIFAVIFGYVGFILRRLDWPLVPLVLGLVLGSIILERMTAGASQVKSLVDLVNRPVSAVLAISVLLILCFVIWSMIKNRRSYKN